VTELRLHAIYHAYQNWLSKTRCSASQRVEGVSNNYKIQPKGEFTATLEEQGSYVAINRHRL